MTLSENVLRLWLRRLSRTALVLGFTLGVILLLLWLARYFEPKVGDVPSNHSDSVSEKKKEVAQVRLVPQPRSESAVGTIRAVQETNIGSKLLARVMEVNLKAGQKVEAGAVLMRLDDTDLRAKLQQAKAALTAAEAARWQAASDEKRFALLIKKEAVTRQEYEKAITTRQAAEAEFERAQETVKEVQANLDWATIRAPLAGTIIDKKVEVGEMVTPGQLLVTLYDPERMQLVASVRESLAYQLKVGQDIGVSIEGINKQCTGTISEIVPEAQAASRSFLVKVTGPCPPGIYSGMFGRIQIPLGKENVLLIPEKARRQVGQLELVDVVDNDQVTRRVIRTGRSFQENVEVLSGLRAGEKVVIPAATTGSKEATNG